MKIKVDWAEVYRKLMCTLYSEAARTIHRPEERRIYEEIMTLARSLKLKCEYEVKEEPNYKAIVEEFKEWVENYNEDIYWDVRGAKFLELVAKHSPAPVKESLEDVVREYLLRASHHISNEFYERFRKALKNNEDICSKKS